MKCVQLHTASEMCAVVYSESNVCGCVCYTKFIDLGNSQNLEQFL